ncbi:MAG: hypothetical protein FGF53_06245 [Candidatus Brockarchaeota archaeon]|nr:hypothetical protein [Candidatus Brockarchaeota archaeon]
MGNMEHHRGLSAEKRAAVVEEYEKKRYTVVGDLAIKAVEQAIEALASLENLHFHASPRSAHAKRMMWVKERFPELSGYVDMLWGAYGVLSYEGTDGERVKKVLEAMEVILDAFERKAGIRFK